MPHVQSGYAHASPPSLLVYARRPTRAQFEYPKASQQSAEMVHTLQLPTRLTSPIQQGHPSSHFERRSRKRVPRAAAAGYWRGQGRRLEVGNMTCVRVPHRLPVVPGWYRVSAIGNAHTPAPGANANTNGHRYFCPPSAAAIASPALADAPSLELALIVTTPDARLEQRTAGLLHDPGARDGPPQRPRTHRVPAYLHSQRPAWPKRDIKPAVGKQATIGLSGTVVDLGPACRSRSRTRTRALDPAPAVTVVEIERLARPQGRGGHSGPSRPTSRLVPAPPGSGSATSCVGLP